MLFDLRGRGRRRTIQAIYLFLALLMGGGLVFFGIGGGAGSGGLLDAVGHNSGSSNGSSIISSEVRSAQRQATAKPNDPAAWAALATARFHSAQIGSNYNQATGAFTKQGLAQLGQVAAAWQHYLALRPHRPDVDLAREMVGAFGPGALQQYDAATAAQEIVVQSEPHSYAQYGRLSALAYLAGQNSKGDLAAQRAIALAPPDQRNTIKDELAAAKSQAQQQAAQKARGPAATGAGAALPSG